jgi:hypothetical protein
MGDQPDPLEQVLGLQGLFGKLGGNQQDKNGQRCRIDAQNFYFIFQADAQATNDRVSWRLLAGIRPVWA